MSRAQARPRGRVGTHLRSCRWSLAAIAGYAASSACASAPAAPRPVAEPLAAIAAEPLVGAQWAVLAVDLATGDTLLAHEPERRMIPASAMKLLTAVAALDLLGPDFRWETGLWSTGAPDSADLVLSASGDPTFSTRWWDSDVAPLDSLAGSLGELYAVRVTGALVVDASTWDSTSVPPSWMVEDLSVPAGASGGALALAEGETRIELRGGSAPGDPVAVRWWPLGEDEFVRSRLVTVADTAADSPLRVEVGWLPESRALALEGTVAAGHVDTLVVATRDPVRQAAAALDRALAARGVATGSGRRIAWSAGEPLAGGCTTGGLPPCPAARLLGVVASPPLLEVVETTLEASQNWIAEQIIRTVGGAGAGGVGELPQAGPAGRAGWREGTAAARAHVTDVVGVPAQDVRVVDGSGLSVQNLLTPRALVRLLAHARGRPWGEAFRAALPEPGEEESTLETRLAGLEGRVWAKTGTLTNVATLAGYLVDARGREIALAILVNGSNLPVATVREAIDGIVRALAAGL